jgi:hypothetical protein
MKSTKIVEIDLCDLCHREKGHWKNKCSKCKRDMCDQCMESWDVTIRHCTPDKQRSPYGNFSKSTTVDTKCYEYERHYCKECSSEIRGVLEKAGFVKAKAQVDTSVVLD